MFEISVDSFDLLENNDVTEIPVLNKNDLTYDDFFRNFMIQNKPCIIKNITEKWSCANFWITGTDINFDYLREQYGSMTVTVYNCLEKEFNSQKFYETSLNQYLDYFQSNNDLENVQKLDYLKNWHLKNNTDDKFYDVPLYFASDWLNEYCVNCLKDDYRFVYMGPKNTWYVLLLIAFLQV